MRREVAAMLVFLAWYLMVPILDPNNGWTPAPAAMPQWESEGTYNSLDECDRADTWVHAEWIAAIFDGSLPRAAAHELAKGTKCISDNPNDDPALNEDDL
ncbi:MAG: hypothetical protein JO166_01730 [Deltaproteobacteria bacterium]|nr:hypothetical protein [Deltaproteobacteria bacterium]